MSRSERMSSIDTSWLRMDKPTNLMMITGVIMLEGPIDYEAVERRLAEGMLGFPRFRQKVQAFPTGMYWVEDRGFDIKRHIKRARLPGKGGKAALQRYVAELAASPLNPGHPLWQFTVVEDYEGGAAVISRFHHAVADGMALIAVLLSLTDASPDGQPAIDLHHEEPDAEDSPFGLFAPVQHAVKLGVKLSQRAVKEGMSVAAEPAKALKYVRGGLGVAAELGWLAVMPSDSQTSLKGVPGGDKRVAWTDAISLPEVKAIAHALGCSVNDMLLTAVAGALRSYLEDRGENAAGVEVRAMVPVNLRKPGREFELGNYFGVIGLMLPVGIENPLTRLYELRRRMDDLKKSYEPPVTLGLFAALGYAPKLVQDALFDLLATRATAVMTNVPGPQYPLYLAGSRLKQIMFWVPQSGNIGMGVSILSFDGKVQFGLITDAEMVPEPQEIIDRFAPEFEKLVYFALMEDWERTDAEATWPPSGPADAADEPKPARKPAAKRKTPARKANGAAAAKAKPAAVKAAAAKSAGAKPRKPRAGKRAALDGAEAPPSEA
jgi:diacylglycerol O-acyltransferase